ncbi:CHASE3 domain-containing protein [Ottowia sp.]|uniref:CHASE3 domain-containing protein n=1 Tax=Ottowia sp. TaxID=1898956 RepID=UPI002CCBB31D|nr:CHASE3 domain-containing protein [Ottowia sp.]HOB67046.1 CHASE3 domain-containing protein [Ottowia sp.]HPZ55860.1 CHASE3 domain-containing protein [Ottowia sp.]HQD48844.1 CHASE3 domain-containing protein [Ottowia sp.]
MPDSSLHPPRPAPRLRKPLSLRATLFVAALCAIAIMWLNEDTYVRTNQTLGEIQQAHAVRRTVNTLARRLVEAESNQRGFILTGDRAYLEPYQAALADIDRLMRELTEIEPRVLGSGSEAMFAFRNLLSEKIGEMALAVRLRAEDRADVVNFVMTSNVGLQQMRAFHQQADTLLAQADGVVAERRIELYRLLNVSRFGLAAGVLAAFFAFFLYVNQTRALRQSDERQKQLLEAERDALESQVRERTARLTELATYLQQAVEDERAHLARELHDELGALLTAAKLNVARIKSKLPPDATELAERLKHLTETLNQGIALKRRIIEDLRPSSLSNLGLVASLEILTREFADRSGIEVEIAVEPVELDATSELTIYRMVQEALTNIGKYAKAHKVNVSLRNYVYHAEVSVQDDGVGFDPSQLPQASHGLVGMRHRIEASGGRLDINSAPGTGSRITGTIPRRIAKPQDQLAVAVASMSADSYKAPAPPLTAPNAPH